jgi:anti-sigma B factor antagonist
MTMRVSCQTDSKILTAVVVSPTGNLEAVGANTLWESATTHLSEAKPSLLVDLTGVEIMTSAGIGILVRLFHRVQSLGGGMVVFGANDRVREVIEVVMLTDVFQLCDTLEEARTRLVS